jgi:hypothetical protein
MLNKRQRDEELSMLDPLDSNTARNSLRGESRNSARQQYLTDKVEPANVSKMSRRTRDLILGPQRPQKDFTPVRSTERSKSKSNLSKGSTKSKSVAR